MKKVVFIIVAMLLITTCKREWGSPCDSKTTLDPAQWMPKNPAVTYVSGRTVEVRWDYDGKYDIDGFKIDRYISGQISDEGYKVLPAEKTSFTDVLEPDKEYKYVIYSYCASNRSSQVEITHQFRLADVSTGLGSDITNNNAKWSGTVNNEGGASVSDRGFCWDISANPTTDKSKVSGGAGKGDFTAILNGLADNTPYFVRAYAVNTVGISYGEQKEFTSLLGKSLPIVTTDTITAISLTEASGGGTVISDGNAAVTERGVCWSTTDIPTTANAKTSDGGGTGYFSSRMTGLSENTTYFVRAYAINSEGAGYGSLKSFKTGQNLPPSVITANVSGVSTTAAVCGGNVTSAGSAKVTARGVCWSTTENPTTANSKTTDGEGIGTFTSNLSGLAPDTKYYIRAYATNSVATSYGAQVDFTTAKIVPPTVTTTAISGVTESSAASGGNVTSEGNGIVTARGVCWSTSQNPTTANSKTTDGAGPGSFTSSLSGLTANTTYYLRAYATNSAGTSYGSQLDFTTMPVVVPPTVNTASITAVSATTATGGGNVTSDGNASVTARGICWSTSQNPTILNSKTTDGTGVGNFTSSITGLTAKTTYYVRAYATNSKGTSYGSQVSFATSDDVVPPTVTTASISGVTVNSATGGGTVNSDGGAAVTARGVCWSSSQNPTITNSKTTDGTGIGGFTSSITGLTAKTTYYVRAYATNSKGTSYGSQVSFATNEDVVPPTVTTSPITGVAQTTASGGGTVTNEGGTAVTSRGVCWSTSQNPTILNNKTSDGTGIGNFTSSLTGLTAKTTYYVRAYATNSKGTSYGTQVSFATNEDVVPPTVTTAAIYGVTMNSASGGGTVNSDGGAEVTARGVCWSTIQNPTTSNSKSTDGTGIGGYTSSITGLTAKTTYYVRAYATNSKGTSYGSQVSFATNEDIIPPTVTTTPITGIGQTSATGGGNVTNEGGAAVTVRGVCWSTSQNPTTSNSKTTDGTGIGIFTSSISGLTVNTTYYVRAYATNSKGTSYGSQVNFKTDPLIVPPTVTTSAASDITPSSASCGGTVTADGGATVTARGVCWSTSANPTTLNSKTTDGTGTGVFTSSITGLTSQTTYFVRAYATNSVGTSYGSQVTLTTGTEAVPPTVTTSPVSGVTQNSASGGGNVTSDGGASVTARGVCWSTGQNPTILNDKTEDGTGTSSFTSSITGLRANTTYYVRAYATNSKGTSYGGQVNFTTNPIIVPPTVTTNTISGVTRNSATGGGNVTSDGNGTVTARGVCWATSQNPTTANTKTTDGTGIGSFTSNISGLTANVTYYVRAYATNSSGTSYGNQVSLTTNPNTIPTLTTTAISDITQTSALGGGSVTSDGGAAVSARGVCWSTSPEPNISHPKTTNGTGVGNFESNLTALTAGTTYYVRAYATNSFGTGYGNQVTFTTNPPIVPPTVATATISGITTVSATGGGNVSSDGNATVTARGVCWSTSQNPTIAGSKTTDGTGTGGFTSNITGLTANTTYYVRAYATNSAGTGYGSQIPFTTNPVIVPPTVTTSAISGISQTAATGGGIVTSDGYATVTARGVCWSTSPDPITSNSKTTDGTGVGSFTSIITGLTANTTYYVRAYATNSNGTSYGNQVIFATLPLVTTSVISDVTQTSATGGGTVASNGNEEISVRGVCWSTSQNPTISDNKTTDGTGVGSFTSNIAGLTANTTYHVRAYATNSTGTGYGDQVDFTTQADDGNFTDARDGHVYKSVKIGNQIWMAENLAYLPSVSPHLTWSLDSPVYYVYGYDGTSVSEAKATSNYGTFGALYNWPAAVSSCPSGWHLPTDGEWQTLEAGLGMPADQLGIYGERGVLNGVGKQLKSTYSWVSGNGTNSSGFNALAAGYLYNDNWNAQSLATSIWTSTLFDTYQALSRDMTYMTDGIWRNFFYLWDGYSVRCIKD